MLRTKQIEVTMRDLYTGETDTVILAGDMAKRFANSAYKSDFLLGLETVYFKSPYVIKTKKI